MPTPLETQSLLTDDGLDQELKRRGKWVVYNQGLRKSPDQTGYRNKVRKQMILKDLGFSRQESIDGRGYQGVSHHLGIAPDADNATWFAGVGEYVKGKVKDAEDASTVFSQTMDEQFNQADEKIYGEPRMNGFKQQALNEIAGLSSQQKQFLNNIAKVTTQDGFMFSSTAGGRDENKTLEGVPRLDLLLESYGLMTDDEQAKVHELIPLVTGPVFARLPEREAAFSQLILEGTQDVGENLIGFLGRAGNQIADVTIRGKERRRVGVGTKALPRKQGEPAPEPVIDNPKISDEHKRRLLKEEQLGAILKTLRGERRGKIKKGKSVLGFDMATFKQQLAGTGSEMLGMAMGPLFALAKMQEFEEGAIMGSPGQEVGSRMLSSIAKGAIYYRAGRAQLRYLKPSRLGGPKLGRAGLWNLTKRLTMEAVQEGVQEVVPDLIDEVMSRYSEDVNAPNWKAKLEGFLESGVEAGVMMLLLSGASSGVDIGTQAANSRRLAFQTQDVDMLIMNGHGAERAAEIAAMESPEARLKAIQDDAEAGLVEESPDVPEEVVSRVREKLLKNIPEDERTGGPEMMRLPNGSIRIDFPDGSIETVADEDAALAASNNYLRAQADLKQEVLSGNLDTKLKDLKASEVARMEKAHPEQDVKTLPKGSLRGAVEAGLPMEVAVNRIRDLAAQQVASGEIDMDADELAEIYVNDFNSGKEEFKIMGQADPGARIENGMLQAALSLDEDATLVDLWEEGVENHGHAMLNGGHWTLETLEGMLREIETQTGKQFLTGVSREQLLEGWSFVNKAYAVGEMKGITGKLKHIMDTLLQVLMRTVGLSMELDAVRKRGELNPETEANMRAGLGLDAGAFYAGLVTKEQNRQGASTVPKQVTVEPAPAAGYAANLPTEMGSAGFLALSKGVGDGSAIPATLTEKGGGISVETSPNYVASDIETQQWQGTDYAAKAIVPTVQGLREGELVHFSAGNIDTIKAKVAGNKGAEKKIYREYPEIYTKRAYVAFNGYQVETQHGVPKTGYKVRVDESHWYPKDDPLKLREVAGARAEAFGYTTEDRVAVNEIYMGLVRDAGFIGFKADSGTVGVIFQDIDVTQGVAQPMPTMSIVHDKFSSRKVDGGRRYWQSYDKGKSFVDFHIPDKTKTVEVNMLHSESGKMADMVFNDLRKEFPDHKLVVTGRVREWSSKTRYWDTKVKNGTIDGVAGVTFSIKGKKGGKKVPKGKALLGIVDDNFRVKTKLVKEVGVYHDDAFGGHASARAVSRFRVLDNKTILFMEAPDPESSRAIDFELEFKGYEIKTSEGAGMGRYATWSIATNQPPKWPGTKDGGQLALWFDQMDEWENKTDPKTPIIFETGDTITVVVPGLTKGKPWRARELDPETRSVVSEKQFDSRLHAVVHASKQGGAAVMDYFDYRTYSLNPGLNTLVDKVQAKAEEMDQSAGPGVDVYLKMQVNLERLIQRNMNRKNYPKGKVGQDRLSLTQDIAAYDAMLSAFDPTIRAKMGGWATLASKAKHETRVAFLEERLPMLEKHLDMHLRKQYLGLITKAMKRQKVKVENNVPRGRDAEMHDRLDEIAAVMDMSPKDLEGEEGSLEVALAAEADPDNITHLTDRLVMLQMFGGLKVKGPDARPGLDFAEAYAEIQNVVSVGLTRYRAKAEAKRAQNAEEVESLIDDISQGEGVLDPSEAKDREPNMRKMSGQIKEATQGYLYGITNWEWSLNWAMGRREKALKNKNVQRLARMVHLATRKERILNWKGREKTSRALASVFDIEQKGAWRMKLSRKLDKFKTREKTSIKKMKLDSTGESIKIPISKARMIVAGSVEPKTYGLNTWDKESLQALIEANDARKRPKGEESLLEIEGQKVAGEINMKLSQDEGLYLTMMWAQEGARKAMQRWGYSDTVMAQMEEFLTPEAKKMRNFLRAEYDANWHNLNPVYKSRFGVNMPRIKNYAPTAYIHMGKQEQEMILEETTPGASLTPGFAKQRTRHRAQPREDIGALDAYTVHQRGSNHFISWAETVGNLRQTLQHRDVQTALGQFGGKHLKGRINELIEQFADGGNRIKPIWQLDWLRKKFTILALSYNWGVGIKQLTSIPAYMYDMDPKVFAKYEAKFFRELVFKKGASWKKMWALPFVQERYSTGFDRDVMLAMSGQGPRSIANWILEQGMIVGKTGDIVAIIVGGYAVYESTYDKLKAQGVSEQQAVAEATIAFEMSSERAQQSSAIKDMSGYQMGGSVNRLWTMFLTSPIQYYMNTYNALANLKAEGGKADFAKRVIVSHVILPTLFQYAGDLVRNLAKPDEEEEDLNPVDYVRAMLLGPLNGLFILGKGLDIGAGKLVNDIVDVINGDEEDDEKKLKKTKVWAYRNPVIDLVSDVFTGAGDAKEGVKEMIEDPSLNDIGKIIDGLAEASKTWGPAGVYDVGSRFMKSIGLDDDVADMLVPEVEKVGPELRARKKAIYALTMDDSEKRYVDFAHSIVKLLKGFSQEEIEKILSDLPENFIPGVVKDMAFPVLDFLEPLEEEPLEEE